MRTFLFKLHKFRASTLVNICPVSCPYKGKLKEGQKSGQNGTHIHCLAPKSELIFDLKKLAPNLDSDMNVITIETVKHYAYITFIIRKLKLTERSFVSS